VGSVVGSITFTLLVVVCAFLVFRRRLRRTRASTSDDAARAEEDLPPPDYGRVFPDGVWVNSEERAPSDTPPSYVRTLVDRAVNNVRGKRRREGARALPPPPTGNGGPPPPIVSPDVQQPSAAMHGMSWGGRQPEVSGRVPKDVRTSPAAAAMSDRNQGRLLGRPNVPPKNEP
jgi:hypothetical protein